MVKKVITKKKSNNKEIKNAKKIKYEASESAMEIKKYIIVLIGIIAVFVGLYFLTGKLIVKDMIDESESTDTEIGYTEVLMGTIFNRENKKYYVVIYNTKTDENGLAYTIASYRGKTNHETVYSVDLSRKFNSKYYEEGYDKKDIPTSLDDLKVGDYTLYTIESGKITSVISGYDKVVKFFE